MEKISPWLINCVVLLGAILCLCGFTNTTTEPNQVEILSSDVEHFWRAFAEAAKVPMEKRSAVYEREYFDAGSQGLKDFVTFRKVTSAGFTEYVETNREYYQKVRPWIEKVVDQKPVIQAAFHTLKALYPDIRFPKHIYFVVGPQHGAGMNSDNGIILAAEIFATPPGTPYSYNKVSPDYVPFSVVHETIHFNQSFQIADNSTLLQDVISEGTADFIASLVLPEPNVRQKTDRWQYGCAREAALAARFVGEEDMTRTGPWMYNQHPDTGWPPDMGYWLGYRIDQALYDHAPNKTEAIRAMLEVRDFKFFLKATNYPTNTTTCVPEKPARNSKLP